MGRPTIWRCWSRTRWRRWAYGLGALFITLILFLTFSRGAWLVGIPASLAAVAWIKGGRQCPVADVGEVSVFPTTPTQGRARWLVVVLLIVGMLALIPLTQAERFSSLTDLSQGTIFLRTRLWQASWDMVRDHPWLGVGLDNFIYYYGDYIRPGAEVDRWLSHPHNLILDFWLRLGIGGVLLLLGLLVGFFRRAIRVHTATRESDLSILTLGFIGGMVAFVAHGSIDSSFFVIELAYWFMFALAWVGR